MPIYEYSCTSCDHEFEELIMNREQEVNCPNCGADEARKMLSRCRAKLGNTEGLDEAAGSALSGGCGSCSSSSCASCS